MTKQQTAELLDLIADKAKRLRNEGILEVAVDGLSFKLAPAEPPESSGDDAEEEVELGVFEDPATYGRTKTVPGRKRKE